MINQCRKNFNNAEYINQNFFTIVVIIIISLYKSTNARQSGERLQASTLFNQDNAKINTMLFISLYFIPL